MIPFIALVGFMGSGKTSIGRLLAEKLGWPYRDSDEWIEAQGLPIPQIFAQKGEPAFRELESAALQTLTRERCVLATGGGAILREENRALLSRGLVIALDTSFPEIRRRIMASDRPLAGRAEELFEARHPLYASFPFHFHTEDSPAGTTQRILDWLQGEEREIRVALRERSYPIRVAPGSRFELEKASREWAPSDRVFLVTDENVHRLYGASLEQSLRGFQVVSAVVPAGEGAKSLEEAEHLYRRMLEARLDRHSPVIAFGGGVVGDLAGFVASTYQRGVPFIQVPTTLLAQIDSSVGGKVAVNHPLAKNMIGTFYQPRGVLIDPLLLRTLPEREWKSGLAELVKYGVILDPPLFESIEGAVEPILERNTSVMLPLIARACELKAEVVHQDERETGRRAILNFGHTLGHAIEKVAGFGTFSHGAAVSIGMVKAGELAVQAGSFAPSEQARLVRLLARLGLPTELPTLPVEDLLAAMSVDKKNLDGAIRFVLPSRLGQVGLPEAVSAESLRRLLTKG